MKRLFQFTLILSAFCLFSTNNADGEPTNYLLTVKNALSSGPGPRIVENSCSQTVLTKNPFDTKTKSEDLTLFQIEPVEIELTNDFVDYTINESIGLANVRLKDGNGLIVYTQLINTRYIGSGSIDISSLPTGSYTIEIISTEENTRYIAGFDI